MHNRSTAIHAGAEVSCSSELYFPSNPLEKTVNVLRFQTFTLCSHASPACLLPAQTTRRWESLRSSSLALGQPLSEGCRAAAPKMTAMLRQYVANRSSSPPLGSTHSRESANLHFKTCKVKCSVASLTLCSRGCACACAFGLGLGLVANGTRSYNLECYGPDTCKCEASASQPAVHCLLLVCLAAWSPGCACVLCLHLNRSVLADLKLLI